MGNLDEIIRWSISDKVKHDVIEKMDFRAKFEKDEYLRENDGKTNFRDIHKEAISRGERYKRFIDSIIRTLDIPDGSICADLGSGTGTLAAIVSHHSKVEKIYAVEISEQFTSHIMPLTFEHFGAHKEKIARIVGDFNSLEFDDNYLDFAVETGSFHHSEDISLTLRECFRVLKPGGFLLAVERARLNLISEEKRNSVLDRELSSELKKKYGIPEDISYTRRMWGEHELTFEEWNTHLRGAGFMPQMAVIKAFTLLPPFSFLLNKLCSVGPTSFEPFSLGNADWFIRHPHLFYELIKIPIFICKKPPA